MLLQGLAIVALLVAECRAKFFQAVGIRRSADPSSSGRSRAGNGRAACGKASPISLRVRSRSASSASVRSMVIKPLACPVMTGVTEPSGTGGPGHQELERKAVGIFRPRGERQLQLEQRIHQAVLGEFDLAPARDVFRHRQVGDGLVVPARRAIGAGLRPGRPTSCTRHIRRWRKSGSASPARRAPAKPCRPARPPTVFRARANIRAAIRSSRSSYFRSRAADRTSDTQRASSLRSRNRSRCQMVAQGNLTSSDVLV